jgi:hypothetical protein
MMIGKLPSFGDATPPANAPPSSYAVYDLAAGVPGSAVRVAGLTLVRSAFIVPGLYIAGVRGWKMLWGALAASATISFGMYALCWYQMRHPPAQPTSPLPPPNPTETPSA